MLVRLNSKGAAASWLCCLPLSEGKDFDCWLWCQICAEYWRRIKLEFIIEWPLLKQKWKLILFGLCMQYVHGVFTQLAHRLHRPAPALRDLGFAMTPELGDNQHWVSEVLFFIGLISFIVWSFSPFVSQRKRFYTAVLWSRLLMVLVVCQALRMITFTVTSLPGPAHHCRPGEASATREWPKHWWGHVVVDVKRQATRSCGDLIFSSHTTFFLTGILAYHTYGTSKVMKALAWLLGAVLSCLIVASRKHYTVDVVVAWYVVPLVFHFMHRRWTIKRPITDGDDGSLSGDSVDLDLGRDEGELEEVVVTLVAPGNSEQKKPLLPVSAPRGSNTKISAVMLTERDTLASQDTLQPLEAPGHIPAERAPSRMSQNVTNGTGARSRSTSFASLQEMEAASAAVNPFAMLELRHLHPHPHQQQQQHQQEGDRNSATAHRMNSSKPQ